MQSNDIAIEGDVAPAVTDDAMFTDVDNTGCDANYSDENSGFPGNKKSDVPFVPIVAVSVPGWFGEIVL